MTVMRGPHNHREGKGPATPKAPGFPGSAKQFFHSLLRRARPGRLGDQSENLFEKRIAQRKFGSIRRRTSLRYGRDSRFVSSSGKGPPPEAQRYSVESINWP